MTLHNPVPAPRSAESAPSTGVDFFLEPAPHTEASLVRSVAFARPAGTVDVGIQLADGSTRRVSTDATWAALNELAVGDIAWLRPRSRHHAW